MNFQDIIQSLNVFWGKQGCIIGQPYGVEVGAGTGNPHTFFRVLGPEPYNVAYVEPSRRPTDGRYGQSPNRFQHYYQYQVILKPAPNFNQELFIESLIAIGIDPTKHDIRFVEDNWESTPLGAWGLGWEVWCDGMEVAQYTYFQQMAGTPLEVPALEITYGLERIAMYIQDVDTYKELKWNNTTTYADIFERHEFWQATHNFETSTPESLTTLYGIYEKEVQSQLNQKNYWSAYDYLLKLSHAFNLLDARNMISVSERVAKFGQMRKFTEQISALYLKERSDLGYPLKGKVATLTYKPPVLNLNGTTHAKYQNNIAIVELGFEEIPSEYLIEWSRVATHTCFRQQLKTFGITFRKAYVHFSPRRIVMKIVQPSKKGRVVEEIKGPAVSVCFTPEGTPTPVLEGFMKKYGITSSEVSRKSVNEKEIVYAEKVVSRNLEEVLQTIGQALLDLAPKTKWMSWEQGIAPFIRPLRWIVAYHNDKKLPITLMNITSGHVSPLPRYEKPAVVKILSAQQYLQFLRAYGVLVSAKKRATRIERTIKKAGDIKMGRFASMIEKNQYLTENPHTKAEKLQARYAELPRELITLILEKNQMYPMTINDKNEIFYHIVANQYRVHKRIEHGNQKVANARLEDGLFYYNQDAGKSLATFGEELHKVGFHPKAGSYVEKKKRIAKLVSIIADGQISSALKIALELIKNDKATALGREFPTLEGIIGSAYAKREGINAESAELLASHYLPYEPDGSIPTTVDGVTLSLADKIDSLVTLAHVEKLPEGSHDPFEIRKTVYRIITLLIKSNFSIDVYELIKKTSLDTESKVSELIKYLNVRFEQVLLDEGVQQWIAHNVALGTSGNIAKKYEYAKKLTAIANNDKSKSIVMETFKRVTNILDKNSNESLSDGEIELRAPADIALAQFIVGHKTAFMPQDILDIAVLLQTFFDTVMVMDPDIAVRSARIGMLKTIRQNIREYFAISFT